MNNWYLNRLRTFSLPEFPYRFKQFISKYFEETFCQNKKVSCQNVTFNKKILNSIIQEEPDLKPVNIFGKPFVYYGTKHIDWHKDIFSEQSFPKIFSKKIDIKANPNLSAKVVWEVNRLQFLMQIALKYQNTNDDTYLNHFINIIKSWKDNNPYLIGINWYSNIEVNLRLINWFLCWEALDADNLIKKNDNFKAFVSNTWLPLIYQHCIYSYKNPSKYSSANNHLISEYAGLFVASSKWHFKESEKWIRYSQKGLEEEIIKQHSINGINKEEAAEYIQFITDFFLLAYIVAENTNRPFSPQYKQQLYMIFDYIFNFLDCKGHFPNYGDEDDGKCFIIDFCKSFNNFKSLLTSGAILFNNSAFKHKGNGLDAKNLFLLGKAGKEIFELIPDIAIEERSKLYTEEGHFIFRKRENDKEIYLHFDAAPLGFLSIAAHGHADALSVVLTLDGHPILVDAGTYTYHTEKEWRRYFVSTLAHNTICIDNMNQAEYIGPTMWLHHYNIKVLNVQLQGNLEIASAMHSGYNKIGCTHERTVQFDRKKENFILTDQVTTDSKPHHILQQWHLHPQVIIEEVNDFTFILQHVEGKRKVKVQMEPLLNAKTVKGKREPLNGWYSKSFLQKEATHVINGFIETNQQQKIKFKTLFQIL